MEKLNNIFFGAIHGASGHNLLLDAGGIFAAQYLPYVVFLGFLWLAVFQAGWRKKLFFLSESLLALILSRGLLTEIIRFFYYSPRPFEALHFQPLIPESGSSLPSGHAAFFFALATVIYLYDRRWGIWYFAAALVISLARIFTGVHWPLDIVAGAAVGILSGFLVHWLLKKELSKLERAPHLPTESTP